MDTGIYMAETGRERVWGIPRAEQGKVGNLISASLIVRDEEKYLGGCLQSITGLVDEIVVVDTGSGDHSREIAIAHGARLVEYQWRDDLQRRKTARSARVPATGSFTSTPTNGSAPDSGADEAALADRGLCACAVRFYPRTGFTAYPEYRLFRRDPRIRFQSAIHETILPDLEGIIAAGEGHIGSAPLTIDHFGYDGDQSHKFARNLRLLQKQVREDLGGSTCRSIWVASSRSRRNRRGRGCVVAGCRHRAARLGCGPDIALCSSSWRSCRR